ncbi:hypothetical protein [Mesorhizobium abyssinicae]|uniref:hypothetical protein n=1 Tax=Mesorhizobium abyssinicae TaxID=1209958 RepID=UPI003397E370
MPKNQSSVWTGVTMTPGHAKAAMRIQLFERFPPDAPDWEADSERTSWLPRVEVYEAINSVYKPKMGRSVQPANVDRIFTNEYGLVGVQKGTSPTIAAVMDLVEQRFAAPTSTATALSLDGMDVVAHYKVPENESPLRNFTDTYAGLIALLRDAAQPSIDALALICQYDGWVAHLTAWGETAQDGVATPVDKNALVQAIKNASRSSYRLRHELGGVDQEGGEADEESESGDVEEVEREEVPRAKSPLFSLSSFQTLSNELQLECLRSTIDQSHLASMKRKMQKELYFDRAKRFSELFPWRVTEMMHALRAACVAGNEEDRAEFGVRLVKAMSRVLDIEARAEKYTKEDPPPPAPRKEILELRNRLFAGDPSPHTLPDFKSYIDTEHEKVLAKALADKNLGSATAAVALTNP